MGAKTRSALLAYLLLASIYLLYLPHAQFLLDDFGILTRYEQARQSGWAAELQVVSALAQNTFHGQFRFQWLSYLIGYGLFLIFGASPAAMYIAILVVHTACAIVFRQAVEKLGLDSTTGFLAGAMFLVIPTVHDPLLWSFNCAFFVWSMFWFLLYWRRLTTSLVQGALGGREAALQALLLVLALFSGDPVFGLLLAAAPLTGLYLRSKVTVRATLLAWGTVGLAAAFYAFVINQIPLFQQGVGLRYSFSFHNLESNLHHILETYRRLTGLGPGAFYELRPSPATLAAAAIAAVVTLAALARTTPVSRFARPWLLSIALWIVAYGPIWFIRGHEYRYDYVPSPFLALALAIPLVRLPHLGRPLAAILMAGLAAVTIANMEQGWIPQSRNLDKLADVLRRAKPLQPGDLVIASGTPLWIGTAPHFAMLAGWASSGFAERVTGVRGVDVAREIAVEDGRLRVYHRNYMRDLQPAETGRTRVFVTVKDGSLTERTLLAQQVLPDVFRLHALRGYNGPPPEGLFTREQLGLLAGTIYFARLLEGHVAADW